MGGGVTGLAVGDHVIANWLPPCGNCASCLRGQPYLCMTHVIAAYIEPRFLAGETPVFGMAGCGAFAEEMVVPQEGAIKIADDVPFELAALVGCGVMTGVGAVINTARVDRARASRSSAAAGRHRGDQGARLSGAAVIVAVDGGGEACGGAPVRHPHVHPDHGRPVRPNSPGGELDYAFEVVGTPQTIRAAWSAARGAGPSVIVGSNSPDQQVEFTPFGAAVSTARR
jgi:S-(hydroxymethyl)glutathione dehydrogenase/alcohol dehydrogenase